MDSLSWWQWLLAGMLSGGSAVWLIAIARLQRYRRDMLPWEPVRSRLPDSLDLGPIQLLSRESYTDQARPLLLVAKLALVVSSLSGIIFIATL